MLCDNIVGASGRPIFLERGHRRIVHKGQNVIERGAPPTHVLYIASGEVRAYCLNACGNEITLFYINADNIICAEALTSAEMTAVNLDAFTDVELYTLSAADFLAAWFEDGYTVRELLSHFVRRIYQVTSYLCCAHYNRGDDRVAYFLYSAYMETKGPILYTHAQIAAVTGMSAVSVGRILKRFQNEGLIACRYRKIHILDAERLKSSFHALGYMIDDFPPHKVRHH